MMTPLERARVLLSLQRALLGTITPEMRLVDLCWDETQISIRIVVGDDSDPGLMDHANEIEAEVEGDFLPEATVRVSVERIPVGTAVGEYKPFDGQSARAFSRWEG